MEDADFTIGARHDGNASYCHDGLLDEVVVFSELLAAKEIDAIRCGAYSYPMTEVRVEAAGAQVAYTDQDGFVKVEAAGFMAAYGLFAEIGEVRVNAGGLMVAYGTKLPPKRVFPAPNPRVRWQTQTSMRKFPVLI